MRQTQPMTFGGDGTCEPKPGKACWDQHSVVLELTNEWRQYAFRWSDLKQSGGGKQVELDPKEITSLVVRTATIPAPSWEIWLDQIGFFKGQPPPSPFDNSRQEH
jgi:hypothetical protein